MEIRVFDVEHGFCAYAVADNRNVAVFDAGHNSKTGFRPSTYLRKRCTGIEQLIISNYDEDHLSDLAQFRARGPSIAALTRNRSIDADQLERLKREGGCPLGEGMQALLAMMRTYTSSLTSPIDYGGAEFTSFSNPYPTFTDTNNLSLVTFLHYRDVQVIFPGDLEKPGWRELLKRADFRSHLARVKIFIASHHGRESGYCPEVFETCKPWVVVISDEQMQYETQEHCYAQHAAGLKFPSATRYVLTTRCDGMITISQPPGEKVTVRIGGSAG